jgi:uncharacterized membrane protein
LTPAISFVELFAVGEALGDRRCFRGIGLQHLRDVDPAERGEMVEVVDVVVQRVRDQDQIADVLRIDRNGQLHVVARGRIAIRVVRLADRELFEQARELGTELHFSVRG